MGSIRCRFEFSLWIPFKFHLKFASVPGGAHLDSIWIPLGFHLVSDCVTFEFHLDSAPGRVPVGYHAGSIGVQFWVLLA